MLLDTVKSALAGHQRVAKAPGPVPAAVLLPLFRKPGGWHILFTKRGENLHHHGGEISFPGGVCQADDESTLHTALRETWEEVGIPSDRVKILGALDDVYSIYNYIVTPYVGVFPGYLQLTPNAAEIARIIEIPLNHLCRPEIFRTENWRWQGRSTPVHFYTYQEDEVWGMTAEILKQFLDIVFPGRVGEAIEGVESIKADEREGQCMTAS